MIMIIEDNNEWGDYYHSLLEAYEVEWFRNGVEAMERMETKVPELVILDMLLTGPTGVAMLHEMQSYEDLSEVPVVIVSGVILDGDLREYGVVKIYDKCTMKPKELLNVVKQVLQKNE